MQIYSEVTHFHHVFRVYRAGSDFARHVPSWQSTQSTCEWFSYSTCVFDSAPWRRWRDGGVAVTCAELRARACTTALTRSSIASNTHGFDRKPVIETLVDTRFGMAQS